MKESDFFIKLNTMSNITENILKIVKSSDNSMWKELFGLTIFTLDIDHFKNDKEIFQAIQHLDCKTRLSIFRTNPNTCYDWHFDKIRHSAINMLIDGFDSFCAFGEYSLGNTYKNIYKLQYEPNYYYLINVKKTHCVFNFSNNMRYILSIGIPNTTYEDSVNYFVEKKLITL